MMKSTSILLIEDDHDDIQTFSRVLYNLSKQIFLVTIQDGHTAYRLLKSKECEPEYIFLDLNIPVLNGLEFLEKIRKESLIPEIPVIVHSGIDGGGLKEKCTQLGVKRFIGKSPDTLQLTRTLKDCLDL